MLKEIYKKYNSYLDVFDVYGTDYIDSNKEYLVEKASQIKFEEEIYDIDYLIDIITSTPPSIEIMKVFVGLEVDYLKEFSINKDGITVDITYFKVDRGSNLKGVVEEWRGKELSTFTTKFDYKRLNSFDLYTHIHNCIEKLK